MRKMVGLVFLVGCAASGATADHWLLHALHPGPFDASRTPPAPDYSGLDAWAAHPAVEDGSDVALPELPAATEPQVDVFYLHPTTSIGTSWNAPFDDPVIVEATERGGTLIQASAFNGCCAVYGPRYRQAHGLAYTEPSADGDRAIDVAYGDVRRAFDHFLAETGDRGFLLVAHSQGAELGTRLLRERVVGEVRERLVAAYLIGSSVGGDVGVPVCAAADDVGCLVAYNARGPAYATGGLEFSAYAPETMTRRACTNPLSWAEASRHAPVSANEGALFFDVAEPRVVPAFADAQCADGVLRVTELGDLDRDVPSTVLLWLMGPQNYHPVEFQLFYVNLRRNAIARADAWLR